MKPPGLSAVAFVAQRASPHESGTATPEPAVLGRAARVLAHLPTRAPTAAGVVRALWRFFTKDFFRVHLSVFLAITLCAGRIIASNDGVDYLDGWFLSVSAITAGGLVTMDMSKLTSGSHAVLYILFTAAGVTFTALPPLLWRVWLFRARFRPLIAEAQALTVAAAESRASEAAAAQRLAAALAAVEAAAAKRTKAAAEKAAAAWSAPSSAASAAALAAAESASAELTLSPGEALEGLLAAASSAKAAARPSGSPSPPPTPPLARGASFSLEAAAAVEHVDAKPLHPTRSFALFFGGGARADKAGAAASSPEADAAARALAAEAAAAEAGRAAAAAAAFSEEDAADYAALSADFEAQNEALEAVAIVVALYVLAWQVFGALAYAGCYDAVGPHLPSLTQRGISRAWLATFLTSSALNNTGLSLLDDSLISLALRTDALMVLAAAILAGNTAWPVALRCTLRAWSALGAAAGGASAGGWRRCRGVNYALAHPERCYHLLFDARGTAAVAAAVALTTAFQLAFFYATSADKVAAYLADLAAAQGVPPPSPAAVRAVMFFQVISVRSAGFQVIDLKRVADVVNVIFAFMFWFAPHPFVAALREADESARLGLGAAEVAHAEEEAPEAPPAALASAVGRAGSGVAAPYSVALVPPSLSARTLRLRPARGSAAAAGRLRPSPSVEAFGADAEPPPPLLLGRSAAAASAAAASAAEAEARGRHTLRGVVMRRYVARHTSWLFFGYLVVATADHALLEAPPDTPYGRSPTSLFAFLFELLSAYGTNGLSLGYPGVNYNLVGMWRPISKLVVIAVLFLGRHRNMPRAVDRPLATHVRALGGIVAGLRAAARAQRRALEAATAAAEAAEAAAVAAQEPRDEPRRAKGAVAATDAGGHVSLEEALAAVRAHCDKMESEAAAPAEDAVAVRIEDDQL